MPKPVVHIHSDGACSPNPGLGGWAAVLISPAHGNRRRELSGAVPDTTNNRMELLAAVKAFEILNKPCAVTFHTDSRYLRDAFEKKWLDKWQRNGWQTATKNPVKNEDLWRALLTLTEPHDISWVWVRGHHTNRENNRCDELAVRAREAHARNRSS